MAYNKTMQDLDKIINNCCAIYTNSRVKLVDTR